VAVRTNLIEGKTPENRTFLRLLSWIQLIPN